MPLFIFLDDAWDISSSPPTKVRDRLPSEKPSIPSKGAQGAIAYQSTVDAICRVRNGPPVSHVKTPTTPTPSNRTTRSSGSPPPLTGNVVPPNPGLAPASKKRSNKPAASKKTKTARCQNSSVGSSAAGGAVGDGGVTATDGGNPPPLTSTSNPSVWHADFSLLPPDLQVTLNELRAEHTTPRNWMLPDWCSRPDKSKLNILSSELLAWWDTAESRHLDRVSRIHRLSNLSTSSSLYTSIASCTTVGTPSPPLVNPVGMYIPPSTGSSGSSCLHNLPGMHTFANADGIFLSFSNGKNLPSRAETTLPYYRLFDPFRRTHLFSDLATVFEPVKVHDYLLNCAQLLSVGRSSESMWASSFLLYSQQLADLPAFSTPAKFARFCSFHYELYDYHALSLEDFVPSTDTPTLRESRTEHRDGALLFVIRAITNLSFLSTITFGDAIGTTSWSDVFLPFLNRLSGTEFTYAFLPHIRFLIQQALYFFSCDIRKSHAPSTDWGSQDFVKQQLIRNLSQISVEGGASELFNRRVRPNLRSHLLQSPPSKTPGIPTISPTTDRDLKSVPPKSDNRPSPSKRNFCAYHTLGLLGVKSESNKVFTCTHQSCPRVHLNVNKIKNNAKLRSDIISSFSSGDITLFAKYPSLIANAKLALKNPKAIPKHPPLPEHNTGGGLNQRGAGQQGANPSPP